MSDFSDVDDSDISFVEPNQTQLLHFSVQVKRKCRLFCTRHRNLTTSVAYRYWEQKGLTSALTDQGPYEFAVSGAGDNYIDLANTYLFVEAHIIDDDDTALDGGADVGPVNLWMHSLFSDVSVSMNENMVSPPTSLYHYRAYIEILLSCQRISINGSHVVQGYTGTSR